MCSIQSVTQQWPGTVPQRISTAARSGLAAHGAQAEDYPARPVKLIIPFAAGAGTDQSGRIVADELGKRLGQQFIVENKPGAAAQLGTDFVAKAAPDGYTLLWTVSDGLSVLPAVKLSLPTRCPAVCAIGSIAQQPYTLRFSSRWDFKTFAGLVAYAKQSGHLNGSAGLGSAPHDDRHDCRRSRHQMVTFFAGLGDQRAGGRAG